MNASRTPPTPDAGDPAAAMGADAAADARVTRFDVERLACGELTGADKVRVEAALQSDPKLKAFFDDVVASDRAFLIEQPPAAFFAAQEKRASAMSPSSWKARLQRFVMRWEAGVGVLGAATAIVVVISLGEPQLDPLEQATRTKGGPDGNGGPSVGFFVHDADAARVGVAGEALKAGDRIQLAVKDADKRALVIVGVDGNGLVSIYAKELVTSTNKGPASSNKSSNKPRLLPVSLVLDDTVGPERFFVVYGDDPSTLEAEVRSAAAILGGQVRAGTAALTDVDALDIGDDVAQASVHILKVR